MTQSDVTYQDKLTELRLDLSHPNNNGVVFVFVEGSSDIRIFRKLFDSYSCKVENIPGGKPKVKDCLNDLLPTYPLIIGIIDADFTNLIGTKSSSTNLFFTDFHDMEIQMFAEDDVVHAILFEFTQIPKLDHLSSRQIVFDTIKKICYTKLLNEIENLEYNFDFGFQDLISFSNNTLDFSKYFNRLIIKSPNAKLKDENVVLTKILALENIYNDWRQLMNGHDFAKSIGSYIKFKNSNKTYNHEALICVLRAAYTMNHWKKSMIYQNILNWSVNEKCSVF